MALRIPPRNPFGRRGPRPRLSPVELHTFYQKVRADAPEMDLTEEQFTAELSNFDLYNVTDAMVVDND